MYNIITSLPKYAMIIKGYWKKDENYGDVWCKITEANHDMKELSLSHPKYGGFAWVSTSDCKFAFKLPKDNKKTNQAIKEGKKDGFYLYDGKHDRYIDGLYSKSNDKLIYQYLEKKFGKWSSENALLYMNFECHKYKDGDIVGNYYW